MVVTMVLACSSWTIQLIVQGGPLCAQVGYYCPFLLLPYPNCWLLSSMSLGTVQSISDVESAFQNSHKSEVRMVQQLNQHKYCTDIVH